MDHCPDQPRIEVSAAGLLLPWAAFLALLAWAWRVKDLFNAVPAYGDSLEVLWGLDWYAQTLSHWHNPLFTPAVFAPQGWQVATLAHGPLLFVALLPLYALGGAAFAYNLAVLGAHVLAFGGMYKVARLWLGPLASTVVALMFTFWGYRWFRNSGHIHTLVSSALLPFEVWTWVQARRHPARRWRWYVITGVIWAVAITASLYAIWHVLLLLLVWGLAQLAGRQLKWWALVQGLFISGATALVLSAPTLWLFWRGLSGGLTSFYSVEVLVFFSSSLNSLWAPSPMQPWLGGLARFLNHGPFNEAELANFGLLGFLMALVGVVAVRKDRRYWPLLACAAAGLLFALGPALKINGALLSVSWLGPVDSVLWFVGRHLKPALFTQAQPPGSLASAMPLPDMVVAALVPFWEGARVGSRYALVAAVGLFPLMGWLLDWLKPLWLRIGLALLMLFEFLPAPTGSVPAKPAAHPAFTWLAAQDLAGQGIIDLAASQADRLNILVDGDIVFSTLYHHQATASGVGSYLPAHAAFLQDWFNSTSHPLQNSDLAGVMRSYHVRYILVHMQTGLEQPLVDEARANPELRLVQCFDPPKGVTPWPYRMCILEVKPPANPHFNVIRRDGWSADEAWGTWIAGSQATAAWVATASGTQQLSLSLLPVCLPNQRQHVTIILNAVAVTDHRWDNCDEWPAQIALPAGLVHLGWNNLTIQADVVGQPVDLATGNTIDTRRLSVAVTRLFVTP